MMDPVVSPDWWLEHRADVVLADVRWFLDGRSGRKAYLQGHLPGAVFVDLDDWLTGAPSAADGRHPLPTPERFADGMARTGIGGHDTVLAYDEAGGVIAARLVWMLRALGQDAGLLDGGLAAAPRESGNVDRAVAECAPRPWPAELLATIDEAADRSQVVLDARPRERYAGIGPDVDPRSGHIPGARNVPCRENVGGDGRLRPINELREVFADAGVQDAAGVISTCGSGVTACHTLLVMEHAGLGRGRLFPGSWSQYSATGRPLATGS